MGRGGVEVQNACVEVKCESERERGLVCRDDTVAEQVCVQRGKMPSGVVMRRAGAGKR